MEITRKRYVIKHAMALDNSHILERLDASPTATGLRAPDDVAPYGTKA